MNKAPYTKIEGIVNLTGGEYGDTSVEGVTTLAGDIFANSMRVAGMLTAKGVVHVQETLRVEGKATFHKEVRAGEIHAEGMITAKGGIVAQNLHAEGRIRIEGTLEADRIELKFGRPGAYIRQIHGDKVQLSYHDSNYDDIGSSLVGLFIHTNNPRTVRCEEIDCTELDASHLSCRVIRAHNITLGAGCHIGRVEYSGILNAAPDAVIDERVGI